ncbi:MAG: DUF342 domain-containing protein [Deltaproteobacteria bacterium]|nr:DUF342 domain-containing protein [Deltaproteobacteria bacterium]
MTQLFNEKNEKLVLRAELSPDRLKLFIDVEPLVKGGVQRDDLLVPLKRRISGGEFDLGVIDDIVKNLNQGRKVERRRVLKGREAIDGADGKLVLLVRKFAERGAAKIDDRGFADFAELNLFENIRAGQVVARLYAPKPGKDGVDALGKPLRSRQGKPFRPSLDKSLELQGGQDGYQKIVALKDGLLSEDAGKLLISDVLTLKGDLGFRSGNVNFIGTVIVRGDVLQGFVLRAQRGVEVMGAVRGDVVCSAGAVQVKGFIYGEGGGKVVCAKGLSAMGLEKARVESGGDVVLVKEARASLIMTKASLFLNTGRLLGGETRVTRGVQAKYIGTRTALRTLIVLCSDVEAGSEYLEIQERLRSHDRARALLKLHLGPLAENRTRLSLLQPSHREKLSKLLSKLDEVEASAVALRKKREEMLAQAKSSSTWQVNFLSTLHQGVQVKSQGEVYTPEADMPGPASIEVAGDSKVFTLVEYKELPALVWPDQDSQGGK